MTPELLEAATGCYPRFADFVAPCLEAAMLKYEINTPLRQAHFIAQCAHESGGFQRVEESFNYAPQGLVGTWPHRFYMPPDEPRARVDATKVGRTDAHPADGLAIVNVVYANREGNGDAASGDPARFKGRGYLQLTFRNNYAAFFDAEPTFPVLSYPDVLTTPEGASYSAAWFFHGNGCNQLADLDMIKSITSKINAGLLGLDKRTALVKRAKAAFGI